MTFREALAEVEALPMDFIGEKLGDSGHIIVGFEILKDGQGEFVVNLLGQDNTSGNVMAKTTLPKWLAWKNEKK